MRILVDTHILLWWTLDKKELSKKYIDLLDRQEKNEEQLYLSIISLWEIAKLVTSTRFNISRSLDEWFQELNENALLNILPLNHVIILDSMRLGGGFPKDPADQLIAATARCHGLLLMTADKRIRKSNVVAIV